MRLSPRLRRVTFASAAAVVGIALAAPTAMAMPQHGEVTRQLVWTYAQAQPAIGAPVCDAAGNCISPFTITGGQPSTGDVAGTTIQAGSASLLPDGSIYANSIIEFTGTIRSCGSGTVAMRSTGFNRRVTHQAAW